MSKLKTFEDISWKQHRVGKGAIQGLLPLSRGFELSVVAGEFFYSTPRKNLGTPDAFSSFEVAIFNPEGEFVDDVKGWQTREDINALLSNY